MTEQSTFPEPWRTALYINEYGSVVHAPGPGVSVVPVMPVSVLRALGVKGRSS